LNFYGKADAAIRNDENPKVNAPSNVASVFDPEKENF